MPQIVIANSLTEGFVVFLTADHAWSGSIADAAVANDDHSAGQLLAAAQEAERANAVIDPYLVEVDLNGAVPRPRVYREYIRAFGPSVALPGAG